MKLFVIGNGFDIGHDLPTAYWDFRNYLERTQPRFLQQFEEKYNIYPYMNDDQKKDLLWNTFESNLANIDEDTIIDMAVSIDMGLESGDVGIEDTLYQFFSEEYYYINKLPAYLKLWIRTIKIRDTLPRTSLIKRTSGDVFLSFNYTAVLETVYRINDGNVIHIHGSLREYTDEPIIGHGNKKRIDSIQEKISKAEIIFDEKWSSICRSVKDYYLSTFKDVDKHSYKLSNIGDANIDEVIVIGHSLDGVDMPYFEKIDKFTGGDKKWTVYYHREDEKDFKRNNLLKTGIERSRIELRSSKEFYDLNDAEMKRKAFQLKHGF
ncbi:bacteriophage abortive infection AbiH family protein [Clostridium estertheticum]|uniref:bacteriophage abortive infection AbiH family protein n=1 Tax=Clostridium estertheticum TaxID=238834 RepID=UPI001C6E4149|nr:bacteriophage abortive infection AbiH family protein [Clostridium estertheticum]MBW9171224.1 bacteriophage abortive infection AbiH family protein [Clostridium estertheticum]WLC73919.1 bacteriophage abortive infection AbiH family protein [Clostridium estertheticum]